MRYKLTMMLALAAMVVSCSKGGGSDSAKPAQPTLPPYSYELSDSPIGFDGYEESATDSRAQVRDGNFEHGDAIGVYAYLKPPEDSGYSTSTYMDNLKASLSVTKDDKNQEVRTWYNSQTKYWPADTDIKIRFFAYHPVSYGSGTSFAEYDASNQPFPEITFKPVAIATYQGDFMTSMTGELNKGHADLVNGQVPLHFKHHLAQVRFSANQNGKNDETVKVTGIVLRGAKGSRTGRFLESGFAWDDKATGDATYYVESGFIDGFVNNVNDETGYTQLDATRDARLLIHAQDLIDNAITLDVTFEMTLKKESKDVVIVATQSFTFPAHKYEIGKGVNYQIPINVDEVSSIVLGSVTYEPWEGNEDIYTGELK